MVYDKFAFGDIRLGNEVFPHIYPPFTITSAYPNAENQKRFCTLSSVLFTPHGAPNTPLGTYSCDKIISGAS